MHWVRRGRPVLFTTLAAGVLALSAGFAGALPAAAAPSAGSPQAAGTSPATGTAVSGTGTAAGTGTATGDTTHPGRTVVTFAWGGGNASQLPGLPLFRKYGMKATYYIPSGLVCFPSKQVNCAHSQYLTLPEVRKIAAQGNEIGGLTVTHIHLTSLPRAEVKRQICNDRVNLTRWGFKVTDFAYPFAVENERAQRMAAQCGYNSGLGAGEVAGAGVCELCGLYAENIPPADRMLVRAPVEVNSAKFHWTAATFESIVQQAELHGGGWIVFLIHDICPSYCQYGVTYDQLRQVLSWTHQRLGPDLQVRTVRQVIGGKAKPAVEGPVPARIPAPGVNNPGLTSLASGTGYPACFQPADYGRNSASFSYHRGAGPSGQPAETLDMVSQSSGDAKLMLETDLGACSPQVTAGRSYTIGTWYKSTIPTQFDVYYRNRIGNWTYWRSSTRFGASSDWARASWRTPAVPAGATAISYGLAATDVGSISTTGYSLKLTPPDHTKLVVLALVALFLVAPFVGWRLWHPGAAGRGDDDGSGGDGTGGRDAAAPAVGAAGEPDRSLRGGPGEPGPSGR
jgi:peptidoglycan/xylan/chitin deacetylase (PgdA/CDA1 family)